MLFRSEDVYTGSDGRLWLKDKTGQGRHARVYLLSDDSYTTVEEVMKSTGLCLPTVRLRLYNSNDREKVFAKKHQKNSEWKSHVKRKKKKQRIDDPMVRLMLTFK